MHPLIYAARPLVLDFLATIVFLILVALKVDPAIAAGVAIVIGVGQVAVLKIMKRPIAPLQWLGLGLVLVFGTASLLTHDMRFLMVKPSIIYLLVGAFMLKRGWMMRYMPPIAAGHGEDVMVVFGYVWAGLMFASGIANAVVAVTFTDHWVAFMAIFPMVSKIGLFAVQYVTMRTVVRRRVMAAREVPEGAAA
ncbi:MAG: septation protein IspZ [Phenylobacterium sp.]|uniref:inner membrane-spanning protein YciB n=1 Tax=Phenylobacterium sp. TaxID=1871053 RepID=UPI001B6CF7A0|nr:septation protein IspZ [Phenylobacterium sp.]MBP7650845.1 septation protein IspZ [Phenylobacterium sp.]MBP7815564.1 septation protein IspZ [Phenylobacterium sp.]MBP9755822.1 septation protein IspZ [Phenylobacterium sp.]